MDRQDRKLFDQKRAKIFAQSAEAAAKEKRELADRTSTALQFLKREAREAAKQAESAYQTLQAAKEALDKLETAAYKAAVNAAAKRGNLEAEEKATQRKKLEASHAERLAKEAKEAAEKAQTAETAEEVAAETKKVIEATRAAKDYLLFCTHAPKPDEVNP